MKKLLLFVALLYGDSAYSQLSDSFTDGDIAASPVWSGSNSSNDFRVVSQQLRSNSATANSNFYLSTPNTLAQNCIWEFWINLQFNPSSANYVDVYLSSDQADLQAANINGYFVRIGNTTDEISLYKRTGASSSLLKIIDGADGILNTSNNRALIRVTRSANNQFSLERDLSGIGTSYVIEGSVTDASVAGSQYFGIVVQQSTASFHQKHFFDDLSVRPIHTDNAPPSLLFATAIDSVTIELRFNEALDSTTAKIAANYNLNQGYGTPMTVKTSGDESKYRLTFAKGLKSASYQIEANMLTDKAGNVILADNKATFSYTQPYIAARGDLIISEIFADPSPQIDLPSVEFVEIYNNTNHTVNLTGWRYADASSSAAFPADSILSGQYLILCAKADTSEYKVFGKTIGISPWPSLNNTSDILKLTSPNNLLIDSVAYSDIWHTTAKRTGGWSLERIDHSSLCEGNNIWISSSDSSGGTPGKQNAVHIPNYDQLSFRVDSTKIISNKELSMHFNKPLNKASVTGNLILSPAAGSLTFSSDADSKKLALHFGSAFLANTTYTLTCGNITDCSGKSANGYSFKFTTPKAPPLRSDSAKLYITEIFADPSPEVNLPLVEFVELFNAGSDTIDLSGWTLTDPGTKASIPKHNMLPGEYLILCPLADTALYKTHGKVVGITPWPSLNNASDQIALKSFSGRMVDSVAYIDAWHSTEKKAGGWSLERIDHSSQCQGSAGWQSSTSSNGGTPGKINSVYQDNYDSLAFKADSVKMLSDTTVMIFLNKPANISANSIAFSLSPTVPFKSQNFSQDFKRVELSYSRPFEAGTTYQLSVKSLKDCAGNLLSYDTGSLRFTTAEAPKPRTDTAAIFITEIFADPSPEVKLPLAEFVEIYNPGTDSVDLNNWSLSSSKTKSIFTKAVIAPKQYLVICALSDTELYSDFGKVTGLSPWPSLINAGDKVVLRSFNGRTVDSVNYSDSWHSSSIKRQGGWSLESIDPGSKCRREFVWLSSENRTGGTPGMENSVNRSAYDALPLRADSVWQLSDTSISVSFNKSIDQSSATSAFSLQPPAPDLTTTDFEVKSRKTVLTFAQPLKPATFYQLNIEGLKDCSGKIFNSQNKLSFVTPALPPVRPDSARLFISEFFADPSPEVALPLAEFIEIYNAGHDTIDLEGFSISNSRSKSSIRKGHILPHEYLIICGLADSSNYATRGRVLPVSTFPALTNAGDKIILRSFSSRTIDSVSYSDSWHFTAAKKQGGWTLERINFTSVCKNEFAWRSSTDPSGGSPGTENSVFMPDYDKLSPKADSIRQTSDSTFTIWFSKQVDGYGTKDVLSLVPNAGKIGVKLDSKNTVALVTTTEKLKSATNYNIDIKALKDCSGNEIRQTGLSFSTPTPTAPRPDHARLYITEIFADPSPEVGMPLAEFVEIYNAGSETIDLNGYKLYDNNTSYSLKNFSIKPAEYLILCSVEDTSLYSKHGKTLGISPGLSLINSADKITLRSFSGRLLDSVSYTDKWYKDNTKRNGGWSLERISFTPICSESQNWMASSNERGATPGQQNATHNYYDSTEALKIQKATVVDSLTVSLWFNRAPDSSLASISDNYTVNNGVGTPGKVSLNATLTEATLQFSRAINRGLHYNITLRNISDCTGRTIQSPHNQIEFFYPDVITSGDILISEILFNPRAGGADFIEIYNQSQKILQIKDLVLASGKTDSITSRKEIQTDYLLEPNAYLVLTEDPENIRKEYRSEERFIKMPSMPPANNDEGTIFLLSRGLPIDKLNYTEKMHFQLIKDPKGISLERSSFDRPANAPGNFRSAAASAGYATPGFRNSQAVSSDLPPMDEVALTNQTFSPDNDGFEDALEINHRFSQAGLVATVAVYDTKGLLIKHLAKNTTLSSEGTFVWDGLTENGDRATVGIYIIHIDLFNTTGIVKKIRKACVLAAKL